MSDGFLSTPDPVTGEFQDLQGCQFLLLLSELNESRKTEGMKGKDADEEKERKKTERQRELEGSRQNIQQRIQDREKEVKLLQQEVEAVNGSADKAVEDKNGLHRH
ncbi:hypothetical protein F7725_023670 [Dissostichus mawsoni]|uniref:Uncharacterized protein n=1 Tax=Dissostichus mawsoni TaxID=36200 RepID=A0A7J5XYS1_DISMA|nr:hypothetical protein F7725_023670 [Dissostichus mawsoni]